MLTCGAAPQKQDSVLAVAGVSPCEEKCPAGQVRDEPGPFNAKGRFGRLGGIRLRVTPHGSAKAAGETSRHQPTVSGDAELPALSVTGRRKLFGRHKLGQILRLVERPDFHLAF